MVLLNILTRVSRVTNIRQIYESISKNSENFNIIWWTLFDVSAITEVPTDLLVFLDGKSKIKFFDSSKNDYLLWGGINEIIDEMLVDESFLDKAKMMVYDEYIIRAKLVTKIEQLFKKQSSSLSEDEDGKKGKHVGQGIYLQREGHVMRMITPGFTVYY
jgi:hypothetical protein